MWIGGYCLLPIAAVILAALFLDGCSSIQRDPPPEVWWDMKRQGKFSAQHETEIFADHRDARRPPEGVVARENTEEDTPYYTGMDGDLYIGKSPVPLTMELLKQGQSRFNTYCTPCHDREGEGQGIVPVRTPTWQPSNLMDDRVVEFADGDIFNVITHGRRSMPSYKYQIVVQDRWAIIAYLRVLQRAHHASEQDVPDQEKTELR
jgi:hypothetical protein